MTLQIVSQNSADTEAFAAKLARRLRGGEVIELKSDLGGGKTTFTRGLVEALGSTDQVASPTFMISREYAAGGFRIVHFDFYRMNDPGHVADALLEAALDDKTICIIEWGDIVTDILPSRRTVITFNRDARNEDTRHILVNTYGAYILEGLS